LQRAVHEACMVNTFRKTNNRAIAGFLVPFINMTLVSVLVLYGRSHGLPFPIWVPMVVGVPILMLLGLYFSVTSIPLIEEFGDKDYAYSGLVLNGFLVLLYLFSLLYYFRNY